MGTPKCLVEKTMSLTWHDSCPVGLLQVAFEPLLPLLSLFLPWWKAPDKMVVGLELFLNVIGCAFRAIEIVVVITQQPFLFEQCLSLQLNTSLAEAGKEIGGKCGVSFVLVVVLHGTHRDSLSRTHTR